jgi:flagellar biosynthesis protein FliR
VTISLVQVFGALLTIGVRITGLLLFAPFFGSVAAPSRVKAILVLALTALLYPLAATKMPNMAVAQWPTMVFSELLIGVGIGVVTNLVFDGIQLAGQIASTQMGFSLINLLDPQTQVDSTVMAVFHQTVAMLIFLRLGVHLWLLRALVHSFDYLPPASGHFSAAFVTGVLHAAGAVFSTGIQIAAPILAATVVTDVTLGLLGKASPQLPLLVLGPALKSLLGIAVLITTLKYWPALFQSFFTKSILMTDKLLHLA